MNLNISSGENKQKEMLEKMLVETKLTKYKNKNFFLSNKTRIYLIVILFFSNFALK